jgi:D-alanyl-D-alanine dipeptidase
MPRGLQKRNGPQRAGDMLAAMGPRLRAVILWIALLQPAAAASLPAGLVYLRDVDPSIAQDMRYAGLNNFTGRALPGYDAAECVLRRAVAEALARVQKDLAAQNLGLKVYDCYRPTRAVAAFARWAQAPEPAGAPTKRFYPALDKRRLFALGYIAAHSAHSTGSAVDLTLVERGAPPASAFDRNATYGPCTALAPARAPNSSIDMGTGFDCFDCFDCFDDNSRTASAAISPQQQRWRATLVAAMRKHGFHNYFREWWHFSFGARPAQVFDFPITPRP